MKYENLSMWVAWHLPKSVVYWAAIRLFSAVTSGTYVVVPELTITEALDRWEKDGV